MVYGKVIYDGKLQLCTGLGQALALFSKVTYRKRNNLPYKVLTKIGNLIVNVARNTIPRYKLEKSQTK